MVQWGRRSFFRLLGLGLGGKLLGAAAELTAGAPPAPADALWQDPQAECLGYDVVVVGGGLSGTCAAISAARNGARVALVHERSMLGGNSSSEVKLSPENSSGHHVWTRECGLLDEFQTEERVRNHMPYREGTTNCHWDLVLYEWVIREPNITLYLNTHMHRVIMRDAEIIEAVYCIQLGSERSFQFRAPVFVDATGDGVFAHKAGAEYAWGREARSAYGEPLAGEQPEEKLTGSTLFFRAIDTGRPVPFKRPSWAAEFATEAELGKRNHSYLEGGYWWIEVGTPYHVIKDNNAIIHEGMRQLLGVWDHIKNRGDHGAADYGLEFVGTWPYKREARRILGDYVLTQQHLQDPQPLEDAVAYGVWFIDIHEPGGILKRQQAPVPYAKADANWDARSTRCYGIPLRALYSRNVHNLMMAGRPISTSYVAFSSTRVLATGAMTGQAAGAAAALCTKYRLPPREVALRHAKECQQMVLRQDGHIPGVVNEDPRDLARLAAVSASSHAPLIFPHGTEEQEMARPLAQLFPVSSPRIDQVELLLRSVRSEPVRVRLGLRAAEHVWDFRGERDLAEISVEVPPLFEGWVAFPLRTRVMPERLYYLYSDVQPGLFWKMAVENDEDTLNRCPVGVTPADLPGTQFWRPFLLGRSFCMRITPRSFPFQGQNLNRGTHRPDRWTNLWASDPAMALPAWMELRWPRAVRFNTVQITFDTNANRLVRLPLFRYPECVRNYMLEYHHRGQWRLLHQEDGNYVRRRIHRFSAVKTNRLRLTVHATNGVPNARVYEIRAYDET